MVRLNRALPISHRFLAADMRVDGRRAIDPMTTPAGGGAAPARLLTVATCRTSR
jgi:hypothetical protein